MKTFHLIISSPNGKIFDEKVSGISLRGINGELAVLANHIPFVTAVVPCRLLINFPNGTKKEAKIKSGLLSVTKHSVTISSHNVIFNN